MSNQSNARAIAISAFIGSNNLGDELLFRATCNMVRCLTDARIVAFSLSPTRPYPIQDIQLIQAGKLDQEIHSLRRARLLICGGGGLIQDTTSVYNVIAHSYRVMVAQRLGVPTCYYGVGVNHLKTAFNRVLAQRVLSRAEAMTVRDDESAQAIAGLGIAREQIQVTGDPVLTLELDDAANPVPYRDYVAVSLRHWFETYRLVPVSLVRKWQLSTYEGGARFKRFVTAVARLLDETITSTGLTVAFANLWHERDDLVAAAVQAHMRHADRVWRPPCELTMEQTQRLLRDAHVLVGMRLHSLILAARAETPLVALSYDDKVSSFMRRMGESGATVQVGELHDEEVLHRTTALIRQQIENPSSQRAERFRALAEQERGNERMLRKLLQRYPG